MTETTPPPLRVRDREHATPTDRLQRRRRTESWRTGIENQATRLQMVLDGVVQEEIQREASRKSEIDRSAADEPNRLNEEPIKLNEEPIKLNPVLRRIQNDLSLALEITRSETSQGFLGRLRELWTGSGFEQALAAVNRASETLLLVQPASAVLARLPDLRAGVKDHLRVMDPRFDGYTRIIDAAERRAGLLPSDQPSPQGRADHASQERNEAPSG